MITAALPQNFPPMRLHGLAIMRSMVRLAGEPHCGRFRRATALIFLSLGLDRSRFAGDPNLQSYMYKVPCNRWLTGYTLFFSGEVLLRQSH